VTSKSTILRPRRSPRPARSAPRSSGSAWKSVRSRGLKILQAAPLARLPWLVHGFSTRLGGSSNLRGEKALNLGFTNWDHREAVVANRRALLRALDAEEMQLAPLRQFHSDVIYVLSDSPQEPPRGDASITSIPGFILGVQTADCVPILLADTKRRIVAAVHAGWRGTLKRIVMKTVGRMQMVFGTQPKDIAAALGPAVAGCCYEVGPEVAQAFAGQFTVAREWFEGPFDRLIADDSPNPLQWLNRMPPGHQPPPSRVHLDLRAANRWQLLEAGVAAGNISSSDLCTACRTDLLFSFRREGKDSGRLMAVIGIRPEEA
jgi:YfiH family protein